MSKNNKTEIWYQKAIAPRGLSEGSRYRLLYQDEQGHWFATFNAYRVYSYIPCNENRGCFSENEEFKTKDELIKAMKAYDRRQGFPKAIKLGEFL